MSKFNLQVYKEKYHFSVNFYSIFLLVTFIPDLVGINSTVIRLTFWGLKVLLSVWVIAQTKNILSRFSKWENLILIIYLIYGIDIFIDVFINPLPVIKGMAGKMDFLGYFVIIVILLFFFFFSPFNF